MSPHGSSVHSRKGALPLALLVGMFSACAPTTHPDPPTPENAGARDASAGKVTAEDIQRSPGVPVEQLLMAKVPGLIASRTPDGGISIRIRGSSSIHLSNQPLFVVDGMPVRPGPNGGLSMLRLDDIASVEVLRDPASTAMYGVRGANGVIVIKTKR